MKETNGHNDLKPLLTVADLGRYLSRNRDWIYDAISAGELPAIRVGRAFRFDPDELAVWLEDRRVGTIS